MHFYLFLFFTSFLRLQQTKLLRLLLPNMIESKHLRCPQIEIHPARSPIGNRRWHHELPTTPGEDGRPDELLCATWRLTFSFDAALNYQQAKYLKYW
jgi:hypothetical protein